MGLRNYPDGMRESDIPGYWDTECTTCESYWLENGRDKEHEIDPDCPWCDGTGMVDSREMEKRRSEEAAIDDAYYSRS